MDLYFDPVVPLLGTYPKKPETLTQKNMSTSMFTVALFTIVIIWKEPKCLSVYEWIKQLWDVYTMEYYLATKKKILPFVTAWWIWRTL